MIITKQFLNSSNYVREESKKTAIVLHHTAGGHRPDLQINYWDNDKLGRVAAHYVIGGKSITDGESIYDGDIFQAIDERFYAFHLGIIGNANRFDRCSIGIEICNYGYLVKSVRDGNFYNYVNKVVPKEDVVDLGFNFRGYRYWHRYTDKQIASICNLLKEISNRHQIKLTPLDFSYLPIMKEDKIYGLFTHVNFRRDKFDLCPQPNLVKALAEL